MTPPALPGILQTKKELRWKDQDVCYYEVEKGGMASLSDFYMWLFNWFIKENMVHWSGDQKPEDFYLHKIRGDGVQENLLWWRTTKRINDYIYYTCKVDVQNFGSKETEVMYNGKKVKTDKLGMVMRVWWWVQVDPMNKWEKSMLGKRFPKLAHWFYNYLLNTDMEYHRDKARDMAKRQENELKAFFEMTTNIPMPRSWYPEEGYKWERPKPKEQDFADKPRAPDWQI